MKGKSILALVAVALLAGPVLADYVSINHNMINGTRESSFDGSTLLIWNSIDSNLLTLNDSPALTPPNDYTGATVSLTTNFYDYNSTTHEARFRGGWFGLSFMRNGAGPYTISGPITWMVLEANSLGTNVAGEGLFRATSVTLPGSGVWPAANLSSIKSLEVRFDVPLGSNYDWTTPFSGETTYTLYPNENAAPEPVSLVLLMAGSCLLRRRRA